MWELYNWLTILPGDKAAVMEETRTMCDMIRKGEIKAGKVKVDELESQMEDWSRRD